MNQEELENIQSKHPQDDRISQTKMFGAWLREIEHANYQKLLGEEILQSLCVTRKVILLAKLVIAMKV